MGRNGGKRRGAGRPKKSDEQVLVEKLKPLDEKAFLALERALEFARPWAVKLFMQYRYGMPRQTVLTDSELVIKVKYESNTKSDK